MQYFLNYVLGVKQKPNFKTEKGSIVHKGLELLARRKVCEQNSEPGFHEPELDKYFLASELDVENSIKYAWNHYTLKNESKHNWSDVEFKECLGWTKDVIEMNDGMFSPLNRKVIAPEQYFDIEIREPWAYYDYLDPISEERITGYLAIKGTIDLLTEVNSDTLEYLDWKSGKPYWDWANDKEKTYYDLANDPQLLIYFYALNNLFPQYRTKAVTIFYAQAKSPTTICFGKEDLTKTLEMIKKRFLQIKNNIKPARIIDNPAKKWKCKSFCPHFKKTMENGQNECDFYHTQLQKLGMEKVVKKYGSHSMMHYQDGGGRSNKEGSK